MKNFEIKNIESGRSMIEMLGVLAIIGVLSVGGIAGYSKAMQKYRINKTIEQITLIAGNVRTFFAPQRSYEGLDSRTGFQLIQKAKLVPDEMYGTFAWSEGNNSGNNNGSGSYFSSSIVNPFGGGVHIYSLGKSKADDNKAFVIKVTAISSEVCIELVTHNWTDAYSNVIAIYDGRGANILKAPLDVGEAVSKCAVFDTTNNPGYGPYYIVFVFDATYDDLINRLGSNANF